MVCKHKVDMIANLWSIKMIRKTSLDFLDLTSAHPTLMVSYGVFGSITVLFTLFKIMNNTLPWRSKRMRTLIVFLLLLFMQNAQKLKEKSCGTAYKD